RLEDVRPCVALGLVHVDDDVPLAAELGHGALGIVERLAVPVLGILDGLHAPALDRARDDRRRPAPDRQRLLVRAVDRLHGVPVASTWCRSISIAAKPTASARRVYDARSQPCIVSPR